MRSEEEGEEEAREEEGERRVRGEGKGKDEERGDLWRGTKGRVRASGASEGAGACMFRPRSD